MLVSDGYWTVYDISLIYVFKHEKTWTIQGNQTGVGPGTPRNFMQFVSYQVGTTTLSYCLEIGCPLQSSKYAPYQLKLGFVIFFAFLYFFIGYLSVICFYVFGPSPSRDEVGFHDKLPRRAHFVSMSSGSENPDQTQRGVRTEICKWIPHARTGWKVHVDRRGLMPKCSNSIGGWTGDWTRKWTRKCANRVRGLICQ